MRRTRQIIAVTLLTTALCADRQALAAPAASPPLARAACQIATRLTRSMHPDAPQVAMMRDERPAAQPRKATPLPAVSIRPHPAQCAVDDFRLPPPLA